MPNWNSPGERECRARAEALKARLHRGARSVPHPCLCIRDEQIEIARKNLLRHDWARRCYEGMLALGDHYASRSGAWIEAMIPALSALHVYGTFCPACGGDNTYDSNWDYRDPERLTCVHCKAVMTDQRFPEDGRLTLPRSGQTFTYYLRPEERNDPEFSTGRHAYVWAGRRVHVSPASVIRHRKTGHMTGVARTLAILFRMTGEDRYGRTAAAILRRFAEVYPNYVLRDYWNTAMDCDPLHACDLVVQDRNIGKYEVNACPDQPGKSMLKSAKLIHPFWGGGRMACGGLNAEALMLLNLTEALDLIWDAKDRDGVPFLTEDAQEAVVRDLIAEGLLTFTRWEGINNKVAGCRVGEVALGRFLGAPDYVHRGVSAFDPIVREYFKFDGSSSEGASYYAYTLSNFWQLAEYARGYTDPSGYRKKDRYDRLDLYAPDGAYGTVLRARSLMTLPDGRIPHTADALEGYPGWPRPEWLHTMSAVRMGRAFAPFDRVTRGDTFALFNRPPDAKGAEPPPVRDVFFPGWLQAIFHTGYGRMFQEDLTGTATFLMGFYMPETHNHDDALNIAMFAEGVEVLSDLGYVGDHPVNASLRSTPKHNLVVMDGKNQLGRGVRPAGNVRLIATSPRVKIIEADCRAYEEAEVYSRCCAMVHRGGGPAYVLDVFRVKGGKVHDYAIHGEGRISALPAFSDGASLPLSKRRGTMGGDIEKLRVGKPAERPWSVAWTERPYGEDRKSSETVSGGIHGPLKPAPGDGVPRMSEQMTMRAHFLSPVAEVIVGDGPGQRNHAEIGARHDYLFARNREQGRGNAFVTLIEHYRETPDIRSVRALAPSTVLRAGLPEGVSGPVAVEVVRRSGSDLIIQTAGERDRAKGEREEQGLSPFAFRLSPSEEVAFEGRMAVHSREEDGRLSLFMAGASRFTSPDLAVTLSRSLIEGKIIAFDASGFEADVRLPDAAALAGGFVEVADPQQKCWTAYEIRAVRGRRAELDLFPFNGGTDFRIPSVFHLDQEGEDAFRVRSTASAEVRLRAGRFTRAVFGPKARPVDARVADGWLTVQVEATKDGVLRLL